MVKKLSSISLRIVRDSDSKFLFELLKERDPRANISHKKMPSYNEHLKFVKSKPYTKWYIILKSKHRIGSIYLSKNDESFENGLLEYPQYTKPQVWEEKSVPDVLLSGDHGKIKDWRLSQSEAITRVRRPDLWEKYKKD